MKRLIALVALLGLLFLTGCESEYEAGNTVEDGAWIVTGKHGVYDMIRDTKTGCIYLQHEDTTRSITPYYDENGKVMGCGEKDERYK